jgi:3-hydroxyisobutyrate dehydrogenase-like beta-hydroxyacid dehydrogenase
MTVSSDRITSSDDRLYDVAVLGCGNMGTAFVRALLAAGHRVAAWNRTAARAEALTADGADALPTAAEALVAARLTIVCVSSTDDVRCLLATADAERLRDQAILNVTSGTPEDARALRDLAQDLGIRYLDAAIGAYPEQIGTVDARISVAGDEDLWLAHRPVILDLAGESLFVGTDPAVANAIDAALTGAFYITSLVAFMEAVRFMGSFDISHDVLASLSRYSISVLDHQAKLALDRVAANDFSTDQATLNVYADAAETFAAGLAETGRAPMIETAAQVLREAVEAGLGTVDIAAMSTLPTQQGANA